MTEDVRPQDTLLVAQDREALEALVVDNPDLERLEELLDEFNIFEAVGAVRQELRHSDFLAFLLNPQQAHGLGDVFLKMLLQKTLLANRHASLPVNLVDLDVWTLDESVVLREWQSIDILILNEANKLCVLIENKIDSAESDGQLEKYYRVVGEHYPDWKIIPLFLTPNGTLPGFDAYLPVDYGTIAQLIEAIAERRAASLGSEVKTVLDHYGRMLRRHIVGESEVDILCRRIYQKHQRALDLIFDRRPDRQNEIKELAVDIIRKSTPLFRLDRVYKNEIGFVPEVWADSLPRGEIGWSVGGHVLLFYFENQPSRLRLWLIIGPGPEDLRRRLLDIGFSNPDVFKPPSKSLNKKWNGLLVRPILTEKDYADLEMSDLEAKIRTFWGNFVHSEFPKIADKIESGMGLNGD